MKDYIAFTSPKYRIVLLLIFPIINLMLQMLLAMFTKELTGEAMSSGFSYYIVMYLFLICECFGDAIAFEGMGGRRIDGVTFYQTSEKGISSFRRVLIIDVLRKVIWCVIYIATGIIVIIMWGGEPGFGRGVAPSGAGSALTALLMTLTLLFGENLLVRKLQFFWLGWIIMFLAVMPLSSFLGFVDRTISPVASIIILAVAIVIMGISMVYFPVRKAGRCYYDK